MLLTRILEESDDALKIYKGVRGKNSFVERVNMLISEMKRSEVSVDMLREVSESLEDSSFLKVQAEGHRDPVFSVRGSHRRKVSGFGGLYYILRRQNAGFVAGSGQ